MTHLEDRITRALTQSPTRPSPDLFDRVLDSIEADQRRRRHGILTAAAAAVLVSAVTAATAGNERLLPSTSTPLDRMIGFRMTM